MNIWPNSWLNSLVSVAVSDDTDKCHVTIFGHVAKSGKSGLTRFSPTVSTAWNQPITRFKLFKFFFFLLWFLSSECWLGVSRTGSQTRELQETIFGSRFLSICSLFRIDFVFRVPYPVQDFDWSCLIKENGETHFLFIRASFSFFLFFQLLSRSLLDYKNGRLFSRIFRCFPPAVSNRENWSRTENSRLIDCVHSP